MGITSLRQSVDGGTGTGSNGSFGPLTVTTSAKGFSSPTLAGNLVVAIAYANGGLGGGSTPIATPTLSLAGSWNIAGAAFTYNNAATGLAGAGTIYYIPAAPSGTYADALTAHSTSITNMSAEVTFYEFNVSVGTPLTTIESYATTDNAGSTGSTVPPSTPNLFTISIDLVMVACILQEPTNPGAGYTKGVVCSVASGEAQYQLNVPAGSVATSFGMGGTFPYWGCGAAAFGPGLVTQPVVYISS